MTERDEHELEWWRMFALKFHPNNLPRVGSPLLGYRLVLCYRDPEDDRRYEWNEPREPTGHARPTHA